MYRVNPLTYFIGGLLSTTLANTAISCASNEFLTFNSVANSTCQDYMAPYISANGGYLLNPDNERIGAVCQFCALSSTNTFLESIYTNFSERWRNFGIIWAFIGFNIIATVAIYWVVRVPKGRQETK
jgi:CDR ABC transporter.